LPGLRLIESNRLDVLSQALAAALRKPLPSPLAPEVIVVQSRGMQRWLSMELARMHGVCANVSWPFPNSFVLDMFSRILPGITQPPLFDKDAMTLRIMDCLPVLLENEEFSRIRDYLAGDTGGMKLYQFSSMMANIYDQYVIFRPGLVLGWEEGGVAADYPERWQAVLWKKIIEGREPNHRARLKQLFLRTIAQADSTQLPDRVSIFGISYLPQFHLEVFKGLSEKTDLSLYCLNPCREYWADIVQERRITRIEGMEPGKDLHLESRNDLLAGFGRLGRDFLDMVLDMDPEQKDLFEEGRSSTMLAKVQDDILNLRPAGEGGQVAKEPGDRSIQVHSCHSPMREVEVLLDTLLELFENYPSFPSPRSSPLSGEEDKSRGEEVKSGLEPRDILVMAPDIEVYAPFIRAVFDMDRGDARRIPYSISDRSFRRSSLFADALLAVLDLAGQRFEASLVTDLLDKAPVRDRFGMDEDAVREIHTWVTGANIRWARDGKDKKNSGLPAFEENTWSFGLKRLLLGYAMAGGEEGVFEGIAPFSEMDPAWAGLLGSFADFADRLSACVDELRQERGPSEWSELLLKIIDDLFAADEEALHELLRLKTVVRGLAKTARDAAFAGTVSVDVVRHHLEKAFGSAAEGAGFLERGVTFCSMLPMRSIPFKVICLLGMNHDAFPRRDYASGLDLMAVHPHKGDRSKRDDDLYLFLEALLSAREVLSISYVGQGIQDNTPIPPSVVVSALLEYLDRAFITDNGKPSVSVTTRHCLQAFNPRYFTPGTSLFSYSKDNALAAQALLSPQQGKRDMEVQGEPGDEFKEIDTERFIRFFRNPAEYFLRNRLQAGLPEEAAVVEGREPFSLDGLTRYDVMQRLLHERLAGRAMDAYKDLLRAEGVLPHGMPGEIVLKSMVYEIDNYVPIIRQIVGDGGIIKKDISVSLDGFMLSGMIDTTVGGGFLRFRPADIKAMDLLRAWISHILLQVNRRGASVQSRHLGKKKQALFAPVTDPEAVLKGLLDVYWQGLMRPLHFFPKSSYAYAKEMSKPDGSEGKALDAAVKEWTGRDGYSMAEGEDRAYLICFRDADPFDAEFAGLAFKVFGPLLEHVKEVSL